MVIYIKERHLFRLLFHLWISSAQDITTDGSFNIVKKEGNEMKDLGTRGMNYVLNKDKGDMNTQIVLKIVGVRTLMMEQNVHARTLG